MKLHGVVRTAELAENPPGSDQVEMILRVQGVGRDQPRMIVVPFSLLIGDESLNPEEVTGRGFEALVEQDPSGRWIVEQIGFASRVLRPPE